MLYWIRHPPVDRQDVESFLIKNDIMTLIWVTFPTIFVLAMQMRSFRKMRIEEIYNKDNSVDEDLLGVIDLSKERTLDLSEDRK